MENWRCIKGFEGLYQVSDLGRVRSKDRIVSQMNNGTECEILYPSKLLKLKQEKNGYLTVHLRDKTISKHKKVHRLVSESFIDNPYKKPLVNHKNGVKQDNRVSNLEWCTSKENSRHALETGLHKPTIPKLAKEESVKACSKPVRCLNNNMEFKSSYDAAIWLNDIVFNNTKKIHTVAAKIRNVCAGDRQNCFGYRFHKIN